MRAARLAVVSLVALAAPTATIALLSAAAAPVPPPEDLKVALGKALYFDTNLSNPGGQSCASCHAPEAGFADPNQSLPVSLGALPGRVGGRNAPSAAYAAFSPPFHFDEESGLYVGGQFWDGRAADLVEQAKGPFLNPLEMHNPNQTEVIASVRRAAYAPLFLQVYGPAALNAKNVETAYHHVAEAIAAYESSPEVSPFTSKFDQYLKGQATLTMQEQRGLHLFQRKGNCAACHTLDVPDGAPGPLFTDFTYDNLGLPKNWNNPFLQLPKALNPDGPAAVDLGLGAVLGDPNQFGKFKVPTLRNIALTAPYGHNGYFQSLRDIVEFYNSRDVPAMNWPAPEVPVNVNDSEMGNLGLSPQQVDDLVAFLHTLTDGYVPQ